MINSASKENILPIIKDNVEEFTQVMTDTSKIYKDLSKENYFHFTVNHEFSEYVNGKIHTNTIEGFWSQLKRTIKGTHIKVSKEHLQKYVDEVNFRYQNPHNQRGMFDIILSKVV